MGDTIEGAGATETTNLLSLVEKGFTTEAVAVYGGSVELVRKAIFNGNIPPLPATKANLPYQADLLTSYKNVYYILPFIEKMDYRCADLRKGYFAAFNAEEGKMNSSMSTRSQVMEARAYAGEMALRDCFTSLTGIEVSTSEVLGLSKEVDPYSLQAYEAVTLARRIKGIDFNVCMEWEDDVEPERIRTILEKIDREEAIKAVRESLQRRGVLLYFGPQIYNYQVIPGKEVENEGIVLAPQPLSLAVISGIETLTNEDRRALFAI